MKFNQSERTLFQDTKYTPAANYYHTPSEGKKILTGSLLGPSLKKQQPNFGSSNRFSHKKQKAPGPGSYFKEKNKNETKKSVKTGIVIRQYKKHGFLGGEERHPSIPYLNCNIDEEDEEYIKELQMNEDMSKASDLTKRKSEGHTFARSPRSFNKTSPPKHQDPQLERIAEYSQKMMLLQPSKQKVNFQQQIKKANERRAEIINKMNPEFVPSLELIELITKRRTKYTPGPGTYNQEEINTDDNTRNTFTTARRFSQDKISVLGPGKYQLDEEKKKSISFSKSARNLFNMKEDTDLEHRFYIDPYSSVKKRENIEIKNQAHPFSFGSQVSRFKKLQKENPLVIQNDLKKKRKSKIESVVQQRLQKMYKYEKQSTRESQGLLGISTMMSTID